MLSVVLKYLIFSWWRTLMNEGPCFWDRNWYGDLVFRLGMLRLSNRPPSEWRDECCPCVSEGSMPIAGSGKGQGNSRPEIKRRLLRVGMQGNLNCSPAEMSFLSTSPLDQSIHSRTRWLMQRELPGMRTKRQEPQAWITQPNTALACVMCQLEAWNVPGIASLSCNSFPNCFGLCFSLLLLLWDPMTFLIFRNSNQYLICWYLPSFYISAAIG